MPVLSPPAPRNTIKKTYFVYIYVGGNWELGIGEMKFDYEQTYQGQLDLDVIPESFHGNSGDCHGIANHHSGNGDNVPGSERENIQHH